MKKTVLSVLLVLLLSFVVLGCNKEEEPDPAELSSGAKKAIKDMDVNPDDILVPAGCTFKFFDTFTGADDYLLYLVWTGADATKFSNYKDEWDKKPVKSSVSARALVVGDTKGISNKTDFDTANIIFYTEGGENEASIEIPGDSIVFIGTQPILE